MTLQPRPGLLIERICDALEKTVLADPASPGAQRQLKGALWALRSIASGLDGRSELVRSDIEDMERVLALHADCLEPDGAPAPTNEERHLQLQARVAALEAAAFTPGTAASRKTAAIAQDLRALYGRMLQREAAAMDRALEGPG